MESDPLHPNLARVAAAYDQVSGEWAAGRIPLEEARRRLGELIARDDQGVRWRLSPDNGEWERMTLDGAWVGATPPAWGLATPDGWDLSGGVDPFADPRRIISVRDVDVTRVTDTSSLTGATFRAAAPAPEPTTAQTPSSDWGRRLRWAVVALVALLAVVFSRCSADEPAEAPTPTVAAPFAPV